MIDLKKFLTHLSKGESSITSFNYKKLRVNYLKYYADCLITQAITDKSIFEVTPKVCSKIQESHPKFKQILMDILERYSTVTYEKFGELNFIPKFQSKALLISKLTVEKFLDCGLMRKFAEKSREILDKYRNYWENQHVTEEYKKFEAQKIEENWKIYLKIFSTISDISHWSNTNEDLNEFLVFMDLIHEKTLRNSYPKVTNSFKKLLTDFDKQLEPLINAEDVNPSFKRHVHKILTRKEPITPGWMKINWQMKIWNAERCAKYFVINAISSKNPADFVYFLHFLNGEYFLNIFHFVSLI